MVSTGRNVDSIHGNFIIVFLAQTFCFFNLESKDGYSRRRIGESIKLTVSGNFSPNVSGSSKAKTPPKKDTEPNSSSGSGL